MTTEPTIRWYDKDFNLLFESEGFPTTIVVDHYGQRQTYKVEYSGTETEPPHVSGFIDARGELLQQQWAHPVYYHNPKRGTESSK